MAWPKSGRMMPATPAIKPPKMTAPKMAVPKITVPKSTVPKMPVAKIAAPKASAVPLPKPRAQTRRLHVPNFARPERIGQLVEPKVPHPARNLGGYLHPRKPSSEPEF